MQECIGCGRRGDFSFRWEFKLVDNNSSHFNAWEAENMSEDPRKNQVERDANSIDVCPKCLKKSEIEFDIVVPSKD
jgi:hypothetical protein